MTAEEKSPSYTLAADEKVAPVMVYTQSSIIWGEVVVKEQIRVSTWMRTNAAPDNLCIYNGKVVNISAGSTPPRPMLFLDIHIPNSQILAFHLLPPAKDPVDYDPTEPNRVMMPVSALVGTFRMDGSMRMSSKSNLVKYIEVTRESFTSLYETEIHNSVMTSLGVMRVPYVLVRQSTTIFTTRETAEAK